MRFVAANGTARGQRCGGGGGAAATLALSAGVAWSAYRDLSSCVVSMVRCLGIADDRGAHFIRRRNSW